MKRMKKYIAALLAVVMLMGIIPSLPVSAVLYPGVTGLARQAAAEGIVMLKNENGVVPFDSSKTVSVFGRVQLDYFYVGYGSGGDVNRPYNVNIMEGLRGNPNIRINETLASIYENWVALNPADHGSGWGTWPRFHPEMPLEEDVVRSARESSDTALIVIGRGAGEERECIVAPGSYLLTELEEDMLEKVTAEFDNVVVLLNSGNIIDMSWMEDYPTIDAVFNVWLGGMESGNAIADILSGDESPSGKLPATIAKKYEYYPSSSNFGQSDKAVYEEDIFVGYRYFETFEGASELVQFPFGFGLSYTEFSIDTTSVSVENGKVIVDVTVTNEGDYAGKEVVQVYYGAPQGELGKAKKSLAAYAKTNKIQPGGTDTIRITFDADSMASYDDGGYTGYKSAWVMEEGAYPIYVGNNVSDSIEAGVYNEPSLRVVEQLEEAMAVYPESSAFNRLRPEVDGDVLTEDWTDITPVRTIDLKDRIESSFPEDKPFGLGDQGIDLIDVYNQDATLDEFMAQMTADELLTLTTGAGEMSHPLGIGGNASVFGGITNEMINKYGIPPVSTTDGPSGIRMSGTATLMPVGIVLASTWNDRLIEDLYVGIGKEMLLNGSDDLLAPGMNLHRDPLCGRNFEYFSEDPVLTGVMGANVVRGLQSQGVAATPKHFAANNQETNRSYNDSRVSERALRELYLKGFEICVKTSQPLTMMTAYNKINSVWAHYNYELCEVILRDQWGFDGVVMTDWWMRPSVDPDYPANRDNAYRVRSGVDVLMPGSAGHTGVNMHSGSPATAVSEGRLNPGELQYCAENTLNYVLRSSKFRNDNDLPLYIEDPGDAYFQVEQDVVEDITVDMIYMNGEEVPAFSPLTKSYRFFSRNLSEFPEITANAADGIQLEIVQATPDTPYATVRATKDAAAAVYRIVFTNQAGLEPNPGIENPVYAMLNNIYINGEPVYGFYPTVNTYSAYLTDPDVAEVTVDAPDGVDYTATRTSSKILTIRAESDHQARLYVIMLDYYTPPEEQYLAKSDEFDAGPLNDYWTVGNQTDNYSKEDGYVQIVSEGGDWYQSSQSQHNYVWQHAQGNWESVTKVEFDRAPGENYHQLGVMVYQNSDVFIQCLLEYNNWNGTQAMPYKVSVKSQTNQSTNNATSLSQSDNNAVLGGMPAGTEGPYTLYFKVSKDNNTYIFEVSSDGSDYRRVGTSFTRNDITEPKFALTALDGGTNPGVSYSMTTKYDYVRFDHKEILPPDPPVNPDIPVKDISASGNSKVLLATDHYYITGTSSTGMRAENCSDSRTENPSGRDLGYTYAGAYSLYQINVEKSGYYAINPRVASEADGAAQNMVSFNFDGKQGPKFTVPGTGGWQNWISLEAQPVYLTEGVHRMMLYCDTGGYNLGVLNFDPVDSYGVTVAEMANGTVTAAQEVYQAGETVYLNVKPDSRYKLKEGSLKANGTVVNAANGTYNFTMPAEDVVITAEFVIAVYTKTLEYAITYAERVKEEGALVGVVPAVVTEFNAALDHAKDVVVNSASQDEIDAAAERLIKVIHMLEFKSLDTSDLEALIALAEKYEKDGLKDDTLYTKATFDPFIETLNAARALVADELINVDEDIEALSEAYDSLWDAIFALRFTPNKDRLNSLLTKAKSYDLSLYTASTVTVFTNARTAAETIVNDADADQDTVNAAADGLETAMEGLRFISGKGSGDKTNTVKDDKNNQTNDDGTANTAKPGNTSNPKTGDIGIGSIAILMLISGTIALFSKKRKR